MSLIVFIIIGVLAGWLVSIVVQGGVVEIIADFLVGISGALVGGYFLGWMNVDMGYGFFGALVTATAGAFFFLFLGQLAKKIWA